LKRKKITPLKRQVCRSQDEKMARLVLETVVSRQKRRKVEQLFVSPVLFQPSRRKVAKLFWPMPSQPIKGLVAVLLLCLS
jgi:hypothetical protein